MKGLELNISKVLIDQITLDEFENIIYQEYYVEKIEGNNFIAKVITINYRDESWKDELEKLICNIWGESKYLAYLIRKYCVQIIASQDNEKVFNMVNDLARLNTEYDYEYETLMQFYLFYDELDLVTIGYSNFSEQKLIMQIKEYSKLYIDAYDSNDDYDRILNLKENKSKTINQNEKLASLNSSLKSGENKKWYEFWK